MDRNGKAKRMGNETKGQSGERDRKGKERNVKGRGKGGEERKGNVDGKISREQKHSFATSFYPFL